MRYYKNMEDIIYEPDGIYGKRGYLTSSYKIFNIRDKRAEKFDFHYHEFDKLIFFKSGNVKYIIEGKSYTLKPFDILLVRHGDIHMPVIDENEEYSRTVIFIKSDYSNFSPSMPNCFDTAFKKNVNLIKTDSRMCDILEQFCSESITDEDLLLESMRLNELLILINRAVCNSSCDDICKSDKHIDLLIKYINEHLCEDLSIDTLSKKLYLNKYYLMHKFKEVTGKTIYSYIKTKRLLTAVSMLKDGESAGIVCYRVGYKDYTAFFKAFKQEFEMTPTQFINIQKSNNNKL